METPKNPMTKLTPSSSKLLVSTVAAGLAVIAQQSLAADFSGGALQGIRPEANFRPFQPDPNSDPTKPSNRPFVPRRAEPRLPPKSDKLKLPGLPAEAQTPAGDKTPRLTLKGVIFEGNEAISTEELDEVARPFINRRLSGSELEDLRYQVSLYYVNKGYVNSGALIEKQTVQDGILRLKIVEGRLTDVKVTDVTEEASADDFFSRLWPLRDVYFRSRLADEDQTLNSQDLQERYLKLLNDPQIERLNGTLMPGLHTGEAILDLKVVRTRPYGGYLGADNFSPPSIGSYAGRMGAWVTNLSGFGERVDFNFSATGGSNTYNTGIDIPLNGQGTRFAFRYTNSLNDLIEPPFNTLNVHTNVVSYDGQISHPVLWDLQQKLTLGLNFNIRQDTTTIAGQPFDRPGAKDGETQQTVVRTWQDYVFQQREFDVAFRSTFSVGVDALGATITNQNTGDGRFFDWLGQGVVRYRLPTNDFIPIGTYLSLSGAVQLADDHLLPLEKIAIGGVYTVRGYRQNYLVRDEGFYTALEFAYPIFGGDPGSKHSLFLVPFFNYGGAWDYGDPPIQPNQPGKWLSSAGVGMDWHYSTLSASLYWAQRLDTYILPQGTPYDLQDNGVTFQVNWRSF